MTKHTYYIPDEKDSPIPPEGFTIIGYRVGLIEPVTTGRLDNHTYATLHLRSLEDNYRLECVAADESETIYCPASIEDGLYDTDWYYEDDSVFDLKEYREATR